MSVDIPRPNCAKLRGQGIKTPCPEGCLPGDSTQNSLRRVVNLDSSQAKIGDPNAQATQDAERRMRARSLPGVLQAEADDMVRDEYQYQEQGCRY